MSDPLKKILRKVCSDDLQDREQERLGRQLGSAGDFGRIDDEAKGELEKQHDRFRRQQEFASRLGPAVERLPILTKEEQERRERERPKRRRIEFEGPIEKLIEKYVDPKEVFNHLSVGQLMKYELDGDTGCIYEKGELIFDGEKLVKEGR